MNKEENNKMMMTKKLILGLLVGTMCVMGGASAFAYQEAPMLRAKVAAGELPPLEERLPEEPTVIEPIEEIGQYGGTLYVLATDNFPWQDMGSGPENSKHLLHASRDEDGNIVIEPAIAKGYEMSDDGKTLILYLREGMKWSDGYPFTADDFLFMFEDMDRNDQVSTWDVFPLVKRIKKIDDYTVRFEMDDPYFLMPLMMTWWKGGEWGMFHPKHYLEKWHIKYNPEANELAKEEGFETWAEAFQYHFWWSPGTVGKPTLMPFVLTEFTDTYKVLERNPYYPVVDSAGNQLPYIDKIVSTFVDKEVYQMKVINGEADVAYMKTTFANYPLYKENEKEGDYRVVLIPGADGSNAAFGVNLNSPDPVKRKIYQDVRFRRALSLGINREEINETVCFGLATPRQATIIPSTSYYEEEWGEAYAQYDPDEANRLLDEMGLTERDKDGFRKRPDGETLLLMVEYSSDISPSMLIPILELVGEYWQDVGIKTTIKSVGLLLFLERMSSANHDVLAADIDVSEEINNFSQLAGPWRPHGGRVAWGKDWNIWLEADQRVRRGLQTLEDFEGGKLPGEEPPAEMKELYSWVELRTFTEIGSEEYMELSRKIYDFNAEQVFVIGTVGIVPIPYIAKNNIGNVPTVLDPGWMNALALNYHGDQLFFKQ